MSTRSPVTRKLQSFVRDRRGNVSQMFALALIPMLGIAGFAVDYSITISDQARLEAAADTASLTAITVAQAYIKANGATNTDVNDLQAKAKAAGIAQAQKLFLGQTGGMGSASVGTPTINVVISGSTISANVHFSGTVPTALTKMIGINQMTLGGTAASSLTMPKYLDFYVVADVSGSMGLPSSDAGQSALALINPDNKAQYPNGCVFACHFAWAAGYGLAETNGIQLRIDAVGTSLQALMKTAQQTEVQTGVANQFRVGLYPFIKSVWQYAPLNNDLTAISTAADYKKFGTLLDNGRVHITNPLTGLPMNNPLGSGGTDIDGAVTWSNSFIQSSAIGSGLSSSSPQPFVFLITDGAQDNQRFTPSDDSSNGNWSGSNQATWTDPTKCQALKDRGIKVSVLYLTYTDIQNPTNFAGGEDFAVNIANNSFQGMLTACASPGFFFEANSPAAIDQAMQAMFQQSLQAARLTN